MSATARERLIFALDVDSFEEAQSWVKKLHAKVGLFKVGKQLFTRCGPEIVQMVRDEGGDVFLDLKYHDIPNTVAKAGVEAMTVTWSKELGRLGIRCNAVAPGFIATDMTEALPEKTRRELAAQIPLERLGSADDIAHAVVFLAQEKSAYITGQVLAVNGGMYM